nr:fructosamine kinase family protein [Pseudonocardia acidicola]
MLGTGVRRSVSLGGATRVDLDDGRTVVVKPGHGARAAPAEAAGLRWLAVPGGPPVPEVLAVDEEWLVTGFLQPGGPSRHAAAELGRRLATLHASGAPAFGAPPPDGPVDAWIGLAPMRNVTGPAWAQWYAAERVLPYLRRARDAGTLTSAEASQIEVVCDRLPQLAGPAEPPARLHGDLWSGNVPLLVHTVLFGRAYAAQALTAAHHALKAR